MGFFESSGRPGRGSLDADAFFSLPELPTIAAEWAAIIPLALHLASFRTDYYTTGHIALLGRISVSLFPKLGVLSSLSRLCNNGPEYLDEASVRGSSSRTVRDVRWGSVFPCANGAVSATIAEYAISKAKGRITKMPSKFYHDDEGVDVKRDEGVHRRYQTLHVLEFGRTSSSDGTLLNRMEKSLSTKWSDWATLLISIGASILLGLCGLYGTAVVLLFGAIAQTAARSVRVERPPGYLQNSEAHSACMLVATHTNSNNWYLYVGDRGVVDTLLNKTMIMIDTTQNTALISRLFAFTHIIHLVTITYVAAQKGWDGVALVFLMLLNWKVRIRFSNESLCREWLNSEGVAVEASSFQFTGRTIMIGAIQAFSGSDRTAWMDEIIAPHPRREAWLKIVQQGGQGLSVEDKQPDSDHMNEGAIQRTSQLALLGAKMLRNHFQTTGKRRTGPINQA